MERALTIHTARFSGIITTQTLPENSVRDCLDQGIVVCRQVPPSFPIADSTGAGGKAKEFPERLTAIPELCPTDQVDLEIFQLEKNPLCILQGRAFSTEL